LRQLQGMDASFVAMESHNSPMHIGSILIYNPETAPGGFVRFKDILTFLGSRMQLSRTMRQKLVRVPFDLDYPYWVEDEEFDLEFHVRHVALPKPGDWRQLCIQAARLFARPLDLNRPPWEFTVIEGLDNIDGVAKGSFAFVTKVHHSAIDGMSGIDLMEAMHTLAPDTPRSPPITQMRGRATGWPTRFTSGRSPGSVTIARSRSCMNCSASRFTTSTASCSAAGGRPEGWHCGRYRPTPGCCSIVSGSPSGPTPTQTSCRAASSSGSPSPARSPCGPR